LASKPKVFVREATGLVREIGVRDHALTAMNGVVPMMAITFTPYWVYLAVPGGDPTVGIVLGCIFGIIGYISAYAMSAATFPRSGSPWVMQSRVLSPWVGWPSEVLMWLGWVVALALYPSGMFIWTALIPGLYAMGYSSMNPGLIAMANWLGANPLPTVVLGTIFLIFCMLIAVSGTRRLVRDFQIPVTIVMFIAIFTMIWLYATTSKEQLIALAPKYLGGLKYDEIAGAAKGIPQGAPISWSFAAVMGAAGFSAGSANTYWNAWNVGEVKRAGDVKMQLYSMWIPSIIITVLCAIIFGQLTGLMGRDFLISLVNSAKGPVSFGGATVPYVSMMIADNFWLQALITVGVVCGVLAYVPATWLIITRDMFAWSFDRLLPAKFSEVSERFHTPVYSIVATFIITEILVIIFTYFSTYMGGFLTVGWDLTLTETTVLCIAVALLPLRKSLWENSPVKNWKIAGIPVISIIGIIGAYYNGYAVYLFSTTPATGFAGTGAGWVILGAIVVALVLYPIIKYYRKSQGIDINMIFQEVPPE
jgi:APA family basic amino acid/polyamine antiporter